MNVTVFDSIVAKSDMNQKKLRTTDLNLSILSIHSIITVHIPFEKSHTFIFYNTYFILIPRVKLL